jgi:hypothetical protein
VNDTRALQAHLGHKSAAGALKPNSVCGHIWKPFRQEFEQFQIATDVVNVASPFLQFIFVTARIVLQSHLGRTLAKLLHVVRNFFVGHLWHPCWCCAHLFLSRNDFFLSRNDFTASASSPGRLQGRPGARRRLRQTLAPIVKEPQAAGARSLRAIAAGLVVSEPRAAVSQFGFGLRAAVGLQSILQPAPVGGGFSQAKPTLAPHDACDFLNQMLLSRPLRNMLAHKRLHNRPVNAPPNPLEKSLWR